jgi:hypothetical protein
VGYCGNGPEGNEGYLYDHGNFIPIDDPLGTSGTQAFGINNHGDVVGIVGGQAFVPHNVAAVEAL